MKRFFKWFAVLAFFGLIATTISYAGMRLKVGQLIGDANHEFVERRITFAKDSIPGMSPRWAWKVTWGAVRIPATRNATVWVSPTGGILATVPGNLEDRVEAYLRSRDP